MQRRLAAILAADVAGYSRMMGEDEAATLDLLRQLRAEHLHPIVAGHGGRIAKSMGDGWLVEFQSVVDAVNAAMRLQDALAGHPRLALRIGIHMGDITHEEGDIYGDGVNIAARLEAIAAPGGIAISDVAHSSLDGTLTPSFDDIGSRELKNIARPVRVWMRAPAGGPVDARGAPAPGTDHQRPGYPRLSIQPFGTSDPRPEVQELAHALTSDVMSYLGQLPWLAAAVSETATPGAYRLQAGLRTGSDRLRLEARLFQRDGSEAWSRKFDGALSESFDWQDSTAESLASELIGVILDAETRRLEALDPATLTAEQCLLGGIMAWRSYSPDSFDAALTLHARAIEANPDLLPAYSEAIIVLIAGKTLGFHDRLARFEALLPGWLEAARPHLGTVPALDLSIALADFMQDRDAAAMARRAADVLRRAPFDPRVLAMGGWSFLWAGRQEEALDCHLKCMRFGRFSPYYVAALGGAATALVQLGRPEEALVHAENGLAVSPTYATYYAAKAAAHAALGEMDEAAAAVAQHLALTPHGRSISSWRAYNDYGGSEGGKLYFELMLKAGMDA